MLIRIIHKVLPKLFQTVVEYFVFCILKLPAMYQKCIIKNQAAVKLRWIACLLTKKVCITSIITLEVCCLLVTDIWSWKAYVMKFWNNVKMWWNKINDLLVVIWIFLQITHWYSMDSDNENGLKSLGQDENYFNFFYKSMGWYGQGDHC